jgi:ankyrin repeat protein
MRTTDCSLGPPIDLATRTHTSRQTLEGRLGSSNDDRASGGHQRRWQRRQQQQHAARADRKQHGGPRYSSLLLGCRCVRLERGSKAWWWSRLHHHSFQCACARAHCPCALPLSSTSPLPTTADAAAAELVDAPSRLARALRLPADDAAALALLQSPPPPLDRQIIVAELLRARRFGLVQRAVEQGVVDPNLQLKSRNGVDFSLVHAAASVDALSLLRFLILERGVDPNRVDGHKESPLHAAIINRKERAALFLTRNVPHIDVNVRGRNGATPLMLATENGMLEVIKALVTKGAQVDLEDNEGGTVLIHAAAGEQEDAALYLLEEADAVWNTGGEEYNALPAAAEKGLSRLVKAILRRMRAEALDEEAISGCMEKAAAYGVGHGQVAVLQALAEERRSLSGVIVNGTTLLHLACFAGKQEAAAFLILQDCDPLTHDDRGLMPHHAAAADGRLALLQWLLQRCTIPVDAEGTVPSLGAMALHIAALKGHLETV